jgi:hypothetical protein
VPMASSSRVEPSMSLNRHVTVPLGTVLDAVTGCRARRRQ